MPTLFTQLGNNLEQIITGVEMRRRARRNWMERLMLEQDDSHQDTNSLEESNFKKRGISQSQNVEQLTDHVGGIGKHH